MELYTAEKKKRKNQIRLWCVFCAHVCRFLSFFCWMQSRTESDANEPSSLRCAFAPRNIPGVTLLPKVGKVGWQTGSRKAHQVCHKLGFLNRHVKVQKSHFRFCTTLWKDFRLFLFIRFHIFFAHPAQRSQRFLSNATIHTHTERRTSWRRHFGPADSQIRPSLRHFSESSWRSAVLGPSRDAHSDDSMTSLTHPMTHSAATNNVHNRVPRHEKIN